MRAFHLTTRSACLLLLLAATGVASQQQNLITEIRIGEVEGDERYLFQNVRSGGVANGGLIVVATRGNRQIRVFAPSGEFVREFGRRGRGPGEFEGGYISVGADQIVVTSHTGGSSDGRVQFFSLDGKLLGSRLTYDPPLYSTPLGWTTAGWLFETKRVGGHRWPRGSPFGFDTLSIDLVNTKGNVVKTVLRTPGTQMVAGSGTGEFATERPLFGGQPARAVDRAGRIYVTDHEAYRITIFDAAGRQLRAITRQHKPVPITQAHLNSYANRSRAYLVKIKAPQAELARVVDGRLRAPRPAVMPALGALFVADDGALWVERPDLLADPVIPELILTWGYRIATVPATTYDRFDQDGRFLGSVQLPPKFRPLKVTRDTVLGVQPDDDDVEFIVRYRVGGR